MEFVRTLPAASPADRGRSPRPARRSPPSAAELPYAGGRWTGSRLGGTLTPCRANKSRGLSQPCALPDTSSRPSRESRACTGSMNAVPGRTKSCSRWSPIWGWRETQSQRMMPLEGSERFVCASWPWRLRPSVYALRYRDRLSPLVVRGRDSRSRAAILTSSAGSHSRMPRLLGVGLASPDRGLRAPEFLIGPDLIDDRQLHPT